MFFRKITAGLLVLLLLCGLLTGCSPAKTESDRLSIVVTVFPEYDWIRNILGESADEVDLTFLLDDGVDMHSYQPTVEDLVKISSCDLLVCIGGASDEWIEDALREAVDPDTEVVRLLELLGDSVREEELLEGMEPEEEEESEPDEHAWLSLRCAKLACEKLTETLVALNPDSEAVYRSNSAAYIQKLTELDEKYQTAVDASAHKALLFADRYPFRYLADDYDLECFAAFPGCSSETDASFETVVFLSGRLDELHLPCVLTIEGSDCAIAETVVQTASDDSTPILTLDSMQSSIPDGADYLSLMEQNLETLKIALG